MTRKDLTTAEGVIAWADPYNQSSLMGHPEWWADAEFLAECVRLRANLKTLLRALGNDGGKYVYLNEIQSLLGDEQ